MIDDCSEGTSNSIVDPSIKDAPKLPIKDILERSHARYFFPVALTLEPRYLKALLRRAQSYEAVEKYEDALEGRSRLHFFYTPIRDLR